ncbi:hypothetical protein BGX27_009435 [Mortierella sp. AM989]|nr:hypothetical protein BGX27_009435 [Mortierella sp. AM989]
MWATRTSSTLVTLTFACIATTITLILILSSPAESIPISNESKRYLNHYPRADPPPTKVPIINKAGLDGPAKKPNKPKYEFEILNPAPKDVWTSGSTESLSWVDLALPLSATIDITLVPADPETNPEAIEITRRPFLRYVSAMERTLDIIVPYDLITKTQLMLEQKLEGNLIDQVIENDVYDKDHLGVPTASPELDVTNQTTPTPTNKDIRSQARLYITVYEGKTNKILVRKSVFPIIILKDHEQDRRTLLPPAPTPTPLAGQDIEQNIVDNPSEGILEKKDSEITHREDHVYENNQTQDVNDEDSNRETNDDSDENTDQQDNQVQENSEADEIEEEYELNATTPTSSEIEENTDEDTDEDSGEDLEKTEDEPMDMGHEHTHGHEHGHEHELDEDDTDVEEEEEEEEMGHHGHSHVIDPDHFQNDNDIEIWKEHEDDPGYNPPIKVIDAGTFEITHWIDNKIRFFVGSPYVFAWEFPQSGLGLTGSVSVYVEDAYTGQRYDIAAGNLPSSVQFMYLHPTAMMMSADPTKRIYLRARVELDLFKGGDILRYTAFSKMFFVERGAL